MSKSIGDTKTFVSQELLKSGNLKLVTDSGEAFYIVVGGPAPAIENNVATAITYHVEKKGGKDVNIIDGTGSVVPSLPKTTVTATPAPGGETPVAPAKAPAKAAAKANFGGDYQKPWLPEEARRVAMLNILTATLTSPAVGQQNLGRNDNELVSTIRTVFLASVKLYDEVIQTVE